eukprot:2762485-Amphidinium_carterae.1
MLESKLKHPKSLAARQGLSPIRHLVVARPSGTEEVDSTKLHFSTQLDKKLCELVDLGGMSFCIRDAIIPRVQTFSTMTLSNLLSTDYSSCITTPCEVPGVEFGDGWATSFNRRNRTPELKFIGLKSR